MTECALPKHGRVSCSSCFDGAVVRFDHTVRTDGSWRIKNNPLSWGGQSPEVIVLGFSKGQTQSGAMDKVHHDEIAYKGGRLNLGKILAHVGLINPSTPDGLVKQVNQAISDQNGRFHFGSFIRCGVEQWVPGSDGKGSWVGSGADMLGKFVKDKFGQLVVSNCAKNFLSDLPVSTKLVVMLGMGPKNSYTKACFEVYAQARPGDWKWINDVAYTDGKITVVHVEHFKSQGALIPQWLGEGKHAQHDRRLLGVQSLEAVQYSLK